MPIGPSNFAGFAIKKYCEKSAVDRSAAMDIPMYGKAPSYPLAYCLLFLAVDPV